MPTSKKIDNELERMTKKISAGADFFQTQVVYDSEKTISFLHEARKLNKPILVGVMPLKSVKMAKFMNKDVEGIDVPDEIISRMENEGATGIDITGDFKKKIIDHVDGIHIMAIGDVAGTNTIIEFTENIVQR